MQDSTKVLNQHDNEALKQRSTEAETLKVRHKYRNDGHRLKHANKHDNTEDEKENKKKGQQRLAPWRGSH